jgi:hypothetical protein
MKLWNVFFICICSNSPKFVGLDKEVLDYLINTGNCDTGGGASKSIFFLLF